MARSLLTPGRLAVGMQLPIQSQSTNYAQSWESDACPDELEAIVRAADTSGFDYVAVCDHIAIPDALADAMSTTWYDTVATLSWIAGYTENVHLLSHVYVPAYRHPAAVVKAWTTLDALSAGRAILGVGAGHVADEFALLGVDHGERGRLTDEALTTIREAFRTGRVGDGNIAPRSPRADGPPIWIGGSSKAALRRAGEFGDGWLPQGTPYPEMPAAIETIHQHQERLHGERRPIDVGIITSFVHVGTPTFEPPAGTFTGDPDRIARGLGRLAELGATQLQVRFAARSAAEYADQVARFGTEVAPQLAGP
ncbi:LLM class flavin-dependent oxidoreductase [Actinospongicola halichondriae]|uniref:LLM class flavin-dependent oxidoreductase n=1 Tax=Actinospongicola halichondriae TaxID=3236844 RepID=UPI003D420CCB